MPVSPVPDAGWRRLSEFIADRIGLHFPPERRADLRRGIAGAAEDFGFVDEAACVEWLLSGEVSRLQLHALASHLTVGETYFFRESKTFAVLAEKVLPELIRARRDRGRRLRLWSAGCCTGEEPYSLAILLQQNIPDLADWQVTIMATDISAPFLRKAAAGIYGEWSFRESPSWFKERYFRRTEDGRYAILPEIRRRVTFAPLNLAEDTVPSLATDTNAMDVIFCRNVLMYFTPPQAQKVVANLRSALVDGGWLVVSPSEGTQSLLHGFVPVNFPEVILYRKGHRKTEVAPMAMEVPIVAPVASASEPPLPKSTPEEPPPAVLGPALESASSLARALANEGKLPEALAACERWLATDKLDPAGHYLRAMILQELGDAAEARRSLQRAIYLRQDFVLAHFALGNLAREASRFEEADKHFANALHGLSRCQPDDPVPESDGLTAARLTEMIHSITAFAANP
jgi:chemotaxis protein methyltransferase CheR